MRATNLRTTKNSVLTAITFFVIVAPDMGAWAENLPQPSRTAFRCEVDGKVIYTDSPCLGARKIEINPTRGVSKISGRERIGNDVRLERHREIMADALKPLTGMDAQQMDVYRRRMKLAPSHRKECHDLDGKLTTMEQRERLASGPQISSVQDSLLKLRLRYRALGC